MSIVVSEKVNKSKVLTGLTLGCRLVIREYEIVTITMRWQVEITM